MRDDALKDFLRQHNPWWRAAATGSDPTAWVASDRALSPRAAYDLGYRSAVLEDVAHAALGDGLYLLRGPRRVGKSVALKDLIAELCARSDVDPWQPIYLPADTLTAHDLRRAIALATDLTRAAGGAPRAWIIDEITAVDGWTAEIKVCVTTRALAGTQSSSLVRPRQVPHKLFEISGPAVPATHTTRFGSCCP
ncbi:AAA family ATPase [Phytoactinopolyspora endophytica]|uniref:AAA family ATPase n=1 Tax=Phytoactinopolyspora endophytica TaxID=1642495 RepID=UPI00101D23FF